MTFVTVSFTRRLLGELSMKGSNTSSYEDYASELYQEVEEDKKKLEKTVSLKLTKLIEEKENKVNILILLDQGLIPDDYWLLLSDVNDEHANDLEDEIEYRLGVDNSVLLEEVDDPSEWAIQWQTNRFTRYGDYTVRTVLRTFKSPPLPKKPSQRVILGILYKPKYNSNLRSFVWANSNHTQDDGRGHGHLHKTHPNGVEPSDWLCRYCGKFSLERQKLCHLCGRDVEEAKRFIASEHPDYDSNKKKFILWPPREWSSILTNFEGSDFYLYDAYYLDNYFITPLIGPYKKGSRFNPVISEKTNYPTVTVNVSEIDKNVDEILNTMKYTQRLAEESIRDVKTAENKSKGKLDLNRDVVNRLTRKAGKKRKKITKRRKKITKKRKHKKNP